MPRMQDSGKKRVYMRKRVCRFCQDATIRIDYKDPKQIGRAHV